MAELRCVDGSLLGVVAVLCPDKAGQSYDVTLALARDRQPFALVGERCGHQLARLTEQVVAARASNELAACWPDPDDRFPEPAGSGRCPGPAGSGLADFQPGEREYFTLRSRYRGDPPGAGELRCLLRSSADWLEGSGRWRLRQRAVVEAWGDDGTGVRAVLTSAELVDFLDMVLSKPCDTAPAGLPPAVSAARIVEEPGRPHWRSRRVRGRVPDGSARSGLPAVRAAARGLAHTLSVAQARRGDV